MTTTTIKIHRNTKEVLDEFRKESESYDDIINKMISEIKNRYIIKELAEGYQTQARENKKIAKEWESTSKDWD